MIHFEKVSKIYLGDQVALEEVDLHVDSGEFLSIVGHSGAGKTTLLKMLLAEENPTEGGVYFDSEDVTRFPKKRVVEHRRRIGTVFQDFKLLPKLNAYENIAFAMEALGQTDRQIAADVPHVLDLVDLKGKRWNFPQELSGGEKQRLAIARAIVNQPDLVIADEPTGNLDPINTYDVIQILKRVNDLGTTVILTTHNKGVIDSLGRRVVTMEKGRIVRDDKEGRYAI